MLSTNQTTDLLDLDRLYLDLPQLAGTYQKGKPYPHIAIDDFLDESVCRSAMEAFPGVADEGWIHYLHVNEKKHGLNKMEHLPQVIQSLIKELNSEPFVKWVSELTGIPNLKADEMLEGGGLHQSGRGGYLNVHADFTVHPHKRKWKRRVNLLIYLNEDWLQEYKGELELWERDMSKCVRRILPVFNRAVLFNTDEDSYHGLPEPIQCPEGMTRKSIALYYFTEEEKAPAKRTTNYRARPEDGAKSILIWLDKTLVSMYSRVKSSLGINDDFVSKLLNWFSKK